MSKKPKLLAEVISFAEQAQQAAMPPERLEQDAARSERDLRDRRLTAARPPIPPQAIDAIVADTLKQTPHLRGLTAALKASAAVAVLAGGTGSGKTVAASWAVARHGGRFIHAGLLGRAHEAWDTSTWEELTRCKICVVDDVGDEGDPERFRPALVNLLSERAPIRGGCTILTTNFPQAMLEERYDDHRLWSRVNQSGVYIGKNSEDLRVRK